MQNPVKILIPILLLWLTACTTIAPFSQHAYIQTTSLKVDALLLIEKANSQYNLHTTEAELLHRNLQKMLEFERNRPNNTVTLQMWELLLNPNGNLLGGFIENWKNGNTFTPYFINEKKIQIGKAFDDIAQLESKKIKPKNSNAP